MFTVREQIIPGQVGTASLRLLNAVDQLKLQPFSNTNCSTGRNFQ